ncbi:hypothetical protein [Actinoplanes sp. NPDC026619]|uniref:hypothetical protein n=1 Tax=Actinoplanes sp. NPDC026619 TaxID=3155798 RepID=UPI0033D0D7C0
MGVETGLADRFHAAQHGQQQRGQPLGGSAPSSMSPLRWAPVISVRSSTRSWYARVAVAALSDPR